MTQFNVVNVIPNSHSNETNQDSEPSIGVNPANPQQILISAFTPPDSGQTNGPLFYSEDGGNTWNLNFIVPGGGPLDQTYKFGGVSGEFYGGDISGTSFPGFGFIILNALSTPNPFAPGTMQVLESPTPTDQPFIAATTVRYGPDAGKDRFYIGYNDQRQNSNSGGTGKTSAIDFCLDALAASPTITTAHIEARTTPSQDGPQVRTAVHADGTIYAVFTGWRTSNISAMTQTGNVTTDIVVVRDDNWAAGATPFTALVGGDGLPGFQVQTGVSLYWDTAGGGPNNQDAGALGQERVGGSLSIATHPANSDIVYICWAGIQAGVYTLNVQSSSNRGTSWSPVLLSVPSATNPALAISSAGKIGLLYQLYKGTPPNDTWETHFQDSINGTTWTDTIVCTTPASQPTVTLYNGQAAYPEEPYLGDYIDMVAMGKNFYGTFCANNTPDPANFPATAAGPSNPNGAIFGRNVTTNGPPWNLLGSDGQTVIDISIDPFFLSVVEVPAAADFYVRDWTASPTSGDNGAEPSTQYDFWDSSDVWNQNSTSSPLPPDPDDVPHTENALAGADNYGFARIRRNQLPSAGSGPVNVTAHFLISEFGTGSNFVDDFFSDPSDPDVTFITGDVSVTFADTDLGPLVTPNSTWALAPTSSDHLCIAVEISAPGSPMSAPGLTGMAPGQPGTTLSVIDDNHKAQRNLRVTPAAAGGYGIRFGVVHNSATLLRDLTLGLGLPLRAGRPPEGTFIEIYTDHGVVERLPWRAWGPLTLASMQPGENRWLGVTMPKLPAGGTSLVTISEMKGARPVNGFGIGIRVAPIATVIGYLMGYNGRVLKRLNLGFGVSAAGEDRKPLKGHEEDFDFEEHVRVEENDLRIEIDVRVRRGHRRERPRSGTMSLLEPAQYEKWLRAQVTVFGDCLAALGGTDPFGIAAAIAMIDSAEAEDLVALTSAHAGVLDRFDAQMTMLQKATGDRADILQMVLWHRDLYIRSARLAALPGTPAMRNQLQHFIDGVQRRTVQLDDYGALLSALVPGLGAAAVSLGATAQLTPLITALSTADLARTLQKAHRNLLLTLQQLS